MAIAIGMEQQVQVRGSNGVILWTGTACVGATYTFINTNGATAGLGADGKIAYGEGVCYDSTNSVIPRPETTAAGASPAADLPMSAVYDCISIAGASDLCFIGVALEPIGMAKQGLIAGIGSICGVLTTATLLARGNTVGGSATKGLAAANTTPTMILGTVLKINTVAAPGTGTTGHAGILVNPR